MPTTTNICKIKSFAQVDKMPAINEKVKWNSPISPNYSQVSTFGELQPVSNAIIFC